MFPFAFRSNVLYHSQLTGEYNPSLNGWYWYNDAPWVPQGDGEFNYFYEGSPLVTPDDLFETNSATILGKAHIV